MLTAGKEASEWIRRQDGRVMKPTVVTIGEREFRSRVLALDSSNSLVIPEAIS